MLAPSVRKRRARSLLRRIDAWLHLVSVLKQPDHNQHVEDFAALLLSLWSQLRDGTIDSDAYLQAVGNAYDEAVGEVPAAARVTLDRLRQTALDRATAVQDRVSLPDDHEDAPSDAQRGSMAMGVAGALWAGLQAASAYRTADESGEDALDIWEWQSNDDPATCPDCEALDGQQFALDEINFWPGESDFGDELPDGTACGANCRCELTHEANERSNAPRQSSAQQSLVKVARCHQCHRKLGENVNVGAKLHCPRCREAVTV